MTIPVIIQLTQKIHLYIKIKTPSGRSTFTVYHIDGLRVMVQTGKNDSIITIPAQCFEDIPKYLNNKGWMKIGATHQKDKEETLDSFIKKYTSGTSAASYVAPILELCGIIKIDRNRPAKVKLVK